MLSNSCANDPEIRVIATSKTTLEYLSVDKLYDFLLDHDRNLKPLAEKFKKERVSGIDMINFGEDDHQHFAITYGQKKQLKLIERKLSGIMSTSVDSTAKEHNQAPIRNQTNCLVDFGQNQQHQVEQMSMVLKKFECFMEKLNQQIQRQDSKIKQLESCIEVQSRNISTFMSLREALCSNQHPVSDRHPENSFTDQSPTLRNQMTRIRANIKIIPIVSPTSRGQTIPSIQPDVPIAIHHNKSILYAPARMKSLPTSVEGPVLSSVKFPTVYHPQHLAFVTKPIIKDPYNINNYGTYKVTIYSEDSQHVIVETLIDVVPQIEICVPKQFVVRDSTNNFVPGGVVRLERIGETASVFTGSTDENGTVELPNHLVDGAYTVEIFSPNNSKLQRVRFSMLVFQNRRQDTAKQFIGRSDLKPNQIEVLFTWGALPSDLDSHLYASDGNHIYFENKDGKNMSLDHDITTGYGPETVLFTVQPNVKYVYAVHRYSDEPWLAQSEGELVFSINAQTTKINKFGSQDKFTNRESHKIPVSVPPQARFWIVCMIDGSKKQIQFFDNVFEDHNNYGTNEIGAKYFTA